MDEHDQLSLRRHYSKLCDVRDFDAILRARIREVVPGLTPQGEVHRKNWEYATLTLFLEDVGLGEETEILSVGAGHEEVLFWLANRAGRVVATDIYGEGEFWDREATVTMLTEPGVFAPYPYREARLDVRTMDGRELDFPDDSFDVVYSLSSVEHFGSLYDISRAAQEIGRVLRPGGHAFIVTECFVTHGLPDMRLAQAAVRALTFGRVWAKASPRRRIIDVLTVGEMDRWIIRPSKLTLVQPFDQAVSAESWENVITLRDGREDVPEDRQFPHVLLRAQVSLGALEIRTGVWTSAALALEKPASASPSGGRTQPAPGS